MTIKDEMLLIEAMTNDLKDSVIGFDKHAEELRKRGNPNKPSLGYRSSTNGTTNELE